MRIRSQMCAAFTLLLVASHADATMYNGSGFVEKIFSGDRVSRGPNDSFLISGFASAGSCATNDGLVGLTLRDDEGGRRQLAMVLAAKMTGVQVSIRVDDAVKNANGFCYVFLVELN
jgi:hypothetical protein